MKRQKFSPEFREETAKLVVEGNRSIAAIAREHGLNETTVGNWVKKYREEHAGEEEPPLELSERARLRELERENRDLMLENAFFKKSGGVLREGAAVSERYAFIAAEYADPTVVVDGVAPRLYQMLAWLGVSRSGYHEWRRRGESAAARRRTDLGLKIEALFDAHGGRYGYRRIHAELLRGGEDVGDELVRRLMREMNLVAVQPRPFRRTTIPGEAAADRPDLVQRDFTADRPGVKLVGDITYIRTWEGWLYLATVIDCFNREVIGWAVADHMRADLAVAAVDMAARNHLLEPGCIMHHDRGSQYTSSEYMRKLDQLDLRASVGRTGVCWDNALAESFFGALKNERVHVMVYPTRRKARDDIAWYIEMYYNRRRLHSTLGYRTPNEVRSRYESSLAAA
ncbi:IS3 family transposase [Tsukamurella soli]|uniref:IS3 family transposase n=1 Tax=Tsukamurella soli TaxID=644556 RepID=UPI003CD0567A